MDAAGDLVQHLKRVVASLRASNPKVGIVLANTGPAEVRKERSALIEGKIASAGASSVTVVEIDRAAASKDGLPGVEEARKMAASLAGVMEPLLRQ
jgi:hypothetical protein